MSAVAWKAGAVSLALAIATATSSAAQEVAFKDPTGDDNGTGKYTYPTDPVYKPGSFDLTGFKLKARRDKVEVEVSVAAKLEDPWKTGSGFSVQLVFIFIQTEAKAKEAKTEEDQNEEDQDEATPAAAKGAKTEAAATTAKGMGTKTEAKTGGSKPDAKTGGTKPEAKTSGAKPAAKTAPKPEPKPSPGFTQGLPGLNVQFAPKDAWDRCIILSPLPPSRVKEEVEARAAAMKSAIVIPPHVRSSGHTISATFDRQALGKGDPRTWGYQVVMASYDAFPALTDLLLRRVNETESQHRFGGGTDGDCDPNVIDILAGNGEGDPTEVQEQQQMLQYECNSDNTPRRLATLKLVRVKKEEKEKKNAARPAAAGPPS